MVFLCLKEMAKKRKYIPRDGFVHELGHLLSEKIFESPSRYHDMLDVPAGFDMMF